MLLALFFLKRRPGTTTDCACELHGLHCGGRRCALPQRPPPAFFCMVLLIAISSTKFQLISFFLRGATRVRLHCSKLISFLCFKLILFSCLNLIRLKMIPLPCGCGTVWHSALVSHVIIANLWCQLVVNQNIPKRHIIACNEMPCNKVMAYN